MNIFVLDIDPYKAARYHVDCHCVKMVLESMQLLCTALPYFEPNTKRILPCKATHVNHPCAKWVRECTGNYHWLYRLGNALCSEYTRRYHRMHAFQIPMEHMALDLPISKRTPFALAMPDEYKNPDTVTAYRNYYLGAKRHLAKWKTRTPFWWK